MPERILEILNRTMQVASEGADLHRTLGTLLEDVLDVTGIERGAIGRVTPDGTEYMVCKGFAPFVLPVGAGITARVFESRQITYVEDVSQDVNFVSRLPDGSATGAELIIPLIFQNDIIGMMNLYSEDPDRFPSEPGWPRWLYQSIANFTATLMHLYRTQHDFRELHETAINLGYILPISELVLRMSGLLREFIRFNLLLIVDFERDFADVYFQNQYGFDMWPTASAEGYRRIVSGELEFIDWLRTLNNPLRYPPDDLAGDMPPGYEHVLDMIRKIIPEATFVICSGPMSSHVQPHEKIGLICCIRTGQIPFTHADLTLLDLFSRSAAPSWYVSEEFERLERLGSSPEATEQQQQETTEHQKLLEWLMRMQEGADNVVCLWNAKTFEQIITSRPGRSDGINEQVRQRIMRLARDYRNGQALHQVYHLHHPTEQNMSGNSLLIPVTKINEQNERLALFIELFTTDDEFNTPDDYVRVAQELGGRFIERIHVTRYYRRLEKLFAFTQHITAAGSIPELTDRFLAAVEALFQPDYIAYYRDQAEDYVSRVDDTASQQDVYPISVSDFLDDLKRHGGAFRAYFRSHPAPLRIDNPDDNVPDGWNYLTRIVSSMLAMPVRSDQAGGLLPGLLMASHDENAFDEEDAHLLQLLVTETRILLENMESTRRESQTRAELHKIAIIISQLHNLKNDINALNIRVESFIDKQNHVTGRGQPGKAGDRIEDLKKIKIISNDITEKFEQYEKLSGLLQQTEGSQSIPTAPMLIRDEVHNMLERLCRDNNDAAITNNLAYDVPSPEDFEKYFPTNMQIQVPNFSTADEDTDPPLLAIRDIFRNLFSNALEAMEDNSDHAQLTVTFSEIQVEQRSYLEIQVTDTGRGIEPDNFEKVFEFAFGLEKKQKKQLKMGVGLWVVRQWMRNSQAEIYIDETYTRPGRGARFILRFPILADS